MFYIFVHAPMSEKIFITHHEKKKYIYCNRFMTKSRFITILCMWFTLTTGGHLVEESLSQIDVVIRTILMLWHLLVYLNVVVNKHLLHIYCWLHWSLTLQEQQFHKLCLVSQWVKITVSNHHASLFMCLHSVLGITCAGIQYVMPFIKQSFMR